MSTEQNKFVLDQTPAMKAQALVQIRSRAAQREETDKQIAAYHKLRDEVAGKRGREFWRSLEELADTPEFNDYVKNEFPEQAAEFNDPQGRRTFLKLMGASLALAGFSTACTVQPPENFYPYIEMNEEMIPGKPLFFATAMPDSGIGLLVRSNEGRPNKIEGNPEHPMSQGATDVFAQAELLTMFDPDRSQTIIERGQPSNWSRFTNEVRNNWLERAKANGGAGVRFLTEAVTSPTLGRQMQALVAQYPNARWIQYDSSGGDNARLGAVMATGQPANTFYRFDLARRVLSIDSDFLAAVGTNLRYARDYIARRNDETLDGINRLYAVECTPTQTGAKADHKLPLRPSEIESFARTVAAALGVAGAAGGTQYVVADKPNWIPALVSDLNAHRGSSIVIVGDEQPPAIHALAHAMNAALGNIGQTVFFTEPRVIRPSDGLADLRQLVADMNAGAVETLFIMGGNPVYSAPADLNIRAALERVPHRAHLGLWNDETAELCHFHVPESHFLEAWGDARSADGTIAVMQPLINPLYDSRSAYEFVGALGETIQTNGYDIVRETYAPSLQASGGDKAWRRILHEGVIPNSQFTPLILAVNPNFQFSNVAAQTTAPANGNLEIAFRPDPSIGFGRYSNNGWMQELPNPLTKLTWDNAVLMSPETARDLSISSEYNYKGGGLRSDMVRVSHAGRSVEAPVLIIPGQPRGSLTVHLGYGRTRAGRIGNDIGFNANSIRTADSPFFATGVEIRKTGDRMELATTQIHFLTEDREPVRVATIAEYTADPQHVFAGHHPVPDDQMSMFPQSEHHPYNDEDLPSWGMTIDTNSCVGCNACVIACQSENNIPVVGKEQVARSREMHWLRIDAYYKSPSDDATVNTDDSLNADKTKPTGNPEGPYFQPLMCVHCEQAPCEPVCPVAATVHDAEGLNVMVYNRCIGTRYCSNNCPYKVRRFNFLLYQDWDTEQYKFTRNPEVTVRSRGVMEKCTYCVQRIQWAKIEARKEDRGIADGEIVTACQAVCPTTAIVFGNIEDSNSRVSQMKRSNRSYGLLEELNTRPRTSHLGILRNPNPDIEPPVTPRDTHGRRGTTGTNQHGADSNPQHEGGQPQGGGGEH